MANKWQVPKGDDKLKFAPIQYEKANDPTVQHEHRN